MREAITLVLSNYPLTFLVLGFVVAGIAIARHPAPVPRTLVAERLLRRHLWIAIGLGNLYNFVMHAFFGPMSARFIGWADSPFEFEVALASLGFAFVAFYAGSRGMQARIAAWLGPSVFTLGAAGGHAYQMIHAHNDAPGNAGVIFYTDIFVPVIGLLLLVFAHRARATSG